MECLSSVAAATLPRLCAVVGPVLHGALTIRYAFVGDLVWQVEGLTQREERPWLEARVLGEDPAAVQQSMRRLSAIATRYPQITIVAAHDPRGYVSIPECSPSAVQ
jgi:hypothetical protein